MEKGQSVDPKNHVPMVVPGVLAENDPTQKASGDRPRELLEWLEPFTEVLIPRLLLDFFKPQTRQHWSEPRRPDPKHMQNKKNKDEALVKYGAAMYELGEDARPFRACYSWNGTLSTRSTASSQKTFPKSRSTSQRFLPTGAQHSP